LGWLCQPSWCKIGVAFACEGVFCVVTRLQLGGWLRAARELKR